MVLDDHSGIFVDLTKHRGSRKDQLRLGHCFHFWCGCGEPSTRRGSTQHCFPIILQKYKMLKNKIKIIISLFFILIIVME